MTSYYAAVFAALTALAVVYISFIFTVASGSKNPMPAMRAQWRNAFYNNASRQLYFMCSIYYAISIAVALVSYHYGLVLPAWFIVCATAFHFLGHTFAALQGYGDYRARTNCYKI